MYCTKCGAQTDANPRYCPDCGAAMGAPNAITPRLSRPMQDKKIAGVCAGFARYFNVDVTLVRIVWLVLVFVPCPAGLVAYIVAWIMMPRDPLSLPQGTTTPVTTPHPAA